MTPALKACHVCSSWGHEHYISCQWHWCHHWATVWQRCSGWVVQQNLKWIIFVLEGSSDRSCYLYSAKWRLKNMNLTHRIQLLKECKFIWSETCRNYCWLGTICTTYAVKVVSVRVQKWSDFKTRRSAYILELLKSNRSAYAIRWT